MVCDCYFWEEIALKMSLTKVLRLFLYNQNAQFVPDRQQAEVMPNH